MFVSARAMFNRGASGSTETVNEQAAFGVVPLVAVTVGSLAAAIAGSSVRIGPKPVPETLPWFVTEEVFAEKGVLMVTSNVIATVPPGGSVPTVRLTGANVAKELSNHTASASNGVRLCPTDQPQRLDLTWLLRLGLRTQPRSVFAATHQEIEIVFMVFASFRGLNQGIPDTNGTPVMPVT